MLCTVPSSIFLTGRSNAESAAAAGRARGIPDQYILYQLFIIEVDGGVELSVVKNHFKTDLRGKYSDSVSRWIVNDIERIPVVIALFEIDGLTIELMQASACRIHRVKILKAPKRDKA